MSQSDKIKPVMAWAAVAKQSRVIDPTWIYKTKRDAENYTNSMAVRVEIRDVATVQLEQNRVWNEALETAAKAIERKPYSALGEANAIRSLKR